MKTPKIITVVLLSLVLFSFKNLNSVKVFEKQLVKVGMGKQKILFVLTSHKEKGNTGEKTGFYLSEVSHPWEVLTEAGYEIDFVSPKGGNPPVDGFDLKDPINKKLWEDKIYRKKIENTLKPEEVHPEDYVAIHYAGGHGTMWDFKENQELAKIAAKIYENNGVVSAVCHGPSGLLNIKLSNGKYLIQDKKINGFTNEEERLVKLDKVVPYLLEDALKERGAKFEFSAPWQAHVTVDQRVVTGQNPQSAHGVGKAILQELKNLELVNELPDLHQAIIENDEVKVLELIKNGADINQLDKRMGNAPLHIAAQLDNPKMIKILIDNGAFVNLHTPHAGHTPLMVAAWYSKAENIKELLKAKDINIYAKSPFGGRMARDVIGGFDQNQTEEEKQRYAVLTAIFDAYEKQLKEKIENQKVYQVVIDNKLSDHEKSEKIKALIASGESVNTESYIVGSGNDKHSPLLVAARNNYPETVKVLLEAGAAIGQRGYLMNAIAFHKAGYMGNAEIMKMLVAHKDAQKYINDQGLNNGYTPLHDAIWHGNTEAAKLLIDAGARLDLKTYEGDTPLDLAKRYNYQEIVRYIAKNSAN